MYHLLHKTLFTYLIVHLCTAFYSSETTAYSPSDPSVVIIESPITPLLDQKTILATHLDSQGFLWVSTPLGLHRYDGNNLINASELANFGSQELPSVTQISEDVKGNILLRSKMGEIYLLDTSTMSLKRTESNSSASERLNRNILFSDDRNTIFIADGSSIYNIGGATGGPNSFPSLLPRAELPYSAFLASNSIAGETWLLGQEGLLRFSSRNSSIESISWTVLGLDRFKGSDFSAIHLIENGEICLGTKSGDLLFLRVNLGPDENTVTRSLNLASTIIEIVSFQGTLVVATDDGLAIENSNGQFDWVQASNSSLTNNHLTSLLVDGNHIWIGTYQGLDVLRLSKFQHIRHSYSGARNEIMGFSELPSGEILVASYDGVYITDGDQPGSKNIPNEPVPIDLPDSRVMVTQTWGQQTLLGYRREGFQLWEIGKPPKLIYSHESDGDMPEVTSALSQDTSSLWLGTYNQGLLRLTKGQNEKTPYTYGIHEYLKEESIVGLGMADNGTILVLTEEALFRSNFANNVFVPVTLRIDSRYKPKFLSLSVTPNDEILVGTQRNGIYISKAKASESSNDIELSQIPGNAKLNKSSVYAIEIDDRKDSIWVSSSSGLYLVSQADGSITNFDTSHGLQGNDFNFGASLRDSSGNLYFGGSNGYNKFNPVNIEVEKAPSEIVLTGLKIRGAKAISPVALNHLQEAHLSYKDYLITFEFSVLNFLSPDKNQYRYKLEGFDPDWIENGNRNYATYTNLPAGEYVFLVQGANSSGIWNRDGIRIVITMEPAPWFTWWAWSIYTIIGLCLGYFAKRYYDQLVITRKATALAEQMQTTADMAVDDLQEQVEYQSSLISAARTHNLTTLDYIDKLVETLSERMDCNSEEFSILGTGPRTEALSCLENCILYQSDVLLADMQEYTNRIIPLALSNASVSPETITTVNEVKSRFVPIYIATPLSLILFELLQNSMCHAFEESSNENFVRMSMDAESDRRSGTCTYTIRVQDSGVGLPDPQLLDNPGSSGLSLVRRIVDEMGWSIQLEDFRGTAYLLIIEFLERPSSKDQ